MRMTTFHGAKPIPPSLLEMGGYFIVPKLYKALLKRNALSPGSIERDIVILILDATLGDPERLEWKAITAETIAEWIGFEKGKDPKHIELSLKSLCSPERGILERRKVSRTYEYRCALENWAAAPAYDPNMVEKETTDDSDEPPPAPKVKLVPSEEPLIVMPGKTSKPFTLPPVPKSEWLWRNDSSYPIGVQGYLIDDRLVFVASDERKTNPARERVAPVTLSSRQAAKPALDPLEPLINGFCFRAKVSAISPEKLREVRQTLGDAPLPYLERAALKGARNIQSAAIFVNFAREARRTHEKERELSEIASPPPPEPPPPLPEDGNTPWGAIKRYLARHLSVESFENWFARTVFGSLENGILRVLVPDEQTRRWLEAEYEEVVRRALAFVDVRATVVYECEGSGLEY